jgi:hypothetical protein
VHCSGGIKAFQFTKCCGQMFRRPILIRQRGSIETVRFFIDLEVRYVENVI